MGCEEIPDHARGLDLEQRPGVTGPGDGVQFRGGIVPAWGINSVGDRAILFHLCFGRATVLLRPESDAFLHWCETHVAQFGRRAGAIVWDDIIVKSMHVDDRDGLLRLAGFSWTNEPATGATAAKVADISQARR